MILIPQRLSLTRFLPLVLFSGMVFQVFAKESAANAGQRAFRSLPGEGV
jgi:hypothetical protein